MYFSTGLKGIDTSNADRIEQLIVDTLSALADQGIGLEQLLRHGPRRGEVDSGLGRARRQGEGEQDDGKPAGYSVDLCARIAASIAALKGFGPETFRGRVVFLSATEASNVLPMRP